MKGFMGHFKNLDIYCDIARLQNIFRRKRDIIWHILLVDDSLCSVKNKL